ncbi:hypothetical protein C8R43DRAFT_842773, partial [Mycena crocata]
LDSSISQHEILLKGFQEERAAIQLEIDSFIYPILTIPSEISAEIFLWAVNHGYRLHPTRAPLSLLQVCKVWRALALSLPALWDTISEIGLARALSQGMENFITTWFSRAQTRPLSLNLTSGSEEETPHLHSVISQHASRLQNLVLLISSGSFPNLASIQPFPLLRDLGLHCVGGMVNPQTPMLLFDGAPLLRTLSLGIAPSTLLMPWSQLTKFSASEISLQECLGVLPLLTSLHEFH